ncbi:Cupredoxin [Dendryphion nanum]|uniref:Cupredoxin n=1 Tax=Dendryphion nanum TaxID=256645 RepID=A0A9P9J1U8_9PLEO|nr:Cupredoxin [Dendryphion nanum]
MVAITSILAASTAVFGLVAAAPSSWHVPSTGVIHRITAGSTVENNGLHFEPQNVVAEVGDWIEFHFLAKNHTVVQSSFEKPCEPLAGGNGIFSGFNFATPPGAGENKNVFTFQIKDKNTIWYYCSQTAGDHCQSGMTAVINQNFNNNDKTLAKHKELAKNTKTVQPSANILESKGGNILPNSFCAQGIRCAN